MLGVTNGETTKSDSDFFLINTEVTAPAEVSITTLQLLLHFNFI